MAEKSEALERARDAPKSDAVCLICALSLCCDVLSVRRPRWLAPTDLPLSPWVDRALCAEARQCHFGASSGFLSPRTHLCKLYIEASATFIHFSSSAVWGENIGPLGCPL